MKPHIDYERWLVKSLKDPAAAAHYLTAAVEENDLEVFLLALAHIARAHGMSALARKATLHRVSLHKMLSRKGNPEFQSVLRVIQASGLKMTFQPKTLRKAA